MLLSKIVFCLLLSKIFLFFFQAQKFCQLTRRKDEPIIIRPRLGRWLRPWGQQPDLYSHMMSMRDQFAIGPVSAADSGREGRNQTSTRTWCQGETSLRSLLSPSVPLGEHWQSALGSRPSQALPRRRCRRAKAVLERQLWLKVKCVGISSNYPVSAMLIHTLAFLPAGWSAGAELNN